MSILIKNKEMPKNCNQCVYRHLTMTEGNFCTAIHERINYRDEKLPNCPIIEIKPHGRLIDADVMRVKIVGNNEYMRKVLVGWVDDQPTIIPSEEGD